MKSGIILLWILESTGVDAEAAKVIMIFYYIAVLIFVIGLIASIFNTAQYTKKITQQNEEIIRQLKKINKNTKPTGPQGYNVYQDYERELNIEQTYRENYNGYNNYDNDE